MRKNGEKLLSLALALVMVVALLPATAAAQANRTQFQFSYCDKNDQDYTYRARVTATDASGKVLWTYTTPKGPLAQLEAIEEMGLYNGLYYIKEYEGIVTLDPLTGAVVWKNYDTPAGSIRFDFDEAGNLYLCGGLGPDFWWIDPSGRTVAMIEKLDDNYMWPYNLWYDNGRVMVEMEADRNVGPGSVLTVDLKTARSNYEPWKNAYIQFLKKETPIYDVFDYTRQEKYKLVDINGDAIPELWLDTGMTAAGAKVCTYADGAVKYVYVYTGGFFYAEGQNIFVDNGGHMDVYYNAVYTIENGGFVELHHGDFGALNNTNVQFDSNGMPIYEYFWDGRRVTSDEYDVYLDNACNGLGFSSPFDGAVWNSSLGRYTGNGLCTYDEIITEIQNYVAKAGISSLNPYNFGDETYSFRNYGDSDSAGGHCFGMSITSAGYHNGLLDIGTIGGNANTPLYSFSATQTVKQPICHYQGMQGSYATRATVAGGSFYLSNRYKIASDWQEVVDYVSNHSYDDSGLLQIGFRKNNQGGHAINFLRYENVNGQDRIYAYDNNFPTQETYFYRDSSGSVRQTPVQTFSGAIDCIALRDCRKYFSTVEDFDATRVLYMAEKTARVEGEYTMTYMEVGPTDGEYVMYEIPANVDRVTIVPKIDNATFTYMEKEYSFGKVTDDTRGELKLASSDDGTVGTDSSFQIYEDDSVTSSHFTDVPTTSWYYDAVYWAVEKEITAGTGTNPPTFSPERTCTETEILTFLWRANGEPVSTAQLPFTPKNRWAESALRWAFEKGMVSASFNENTPCTRAAAVKFIWQAAGAPGASSSTFTDVPAGADYARAVAWAVSKGVTAGTSTTTFSPSKTCSRAEIVTFLYRDWSGKT